MKNYYCVKQVYFLNGKIKRFCTEVTATVKPNNNTIWSYKKDVYYSYFDTKEECDKFLDKCFEEVEKNDKP